jgi:AcrR family transcriptional regulator
VPSPQTEDVQVRGARLPREERRAQLLDAAKEVFATRGYHAAAMDEIAAAAGISKPVLYQHFDSKLDLYLALLDRACDSLLGVVQVALGSTDHNADRTVAVIGAFYDFVSSAGGEFRFVFESDLTGVGRVQDRLWQVNNDVADSIAAVIAEDTAMPADQARLLAISLVGLAQVGARYWVSDRRDSIGLEQAKQLVSTLAWRGISGFPLHPTREP